jgi:hypothetical protein
MRIVIAAALALPTALLAQSKGGGYQDPVPHEVITQSYRVCQDLEELTSRINNLYRKPFAKTIARNGVAQPEVIYFKDVTSGHEVMGLTRELCSDISHPDLGRPVWTYDGRHILFMGNRAFLDADGKLHQGTWAGNKFIMNADYSDQRALIVAFVDASGKVIQRNAGMDGKYNILDPRDPRFAYYASGDKLWRLKIAEDGGDNRAELICTLSTTHRKVIQAISLDGKLLIQDLNADLDRATRKPQYMPEIHLINLNKKQGDDGFYYHHPFDYGLPELKDEKGKVVHAADNNYQFHSLMFAGASTDRIGWNYGPMTDVGEYVGWSLDVRHGLDGPPTHSQITGGQTTNPFDQYESHGRPVGPTSMGLYFSGPATIEGGKKIGGYGLWVRNDDDPKSLPRFLSPAAGGHVAGGNSASPEIYAAHFAAPSPKWRADVKECDSIMWGHLSDAKASVLCYTYSDVRGGIKQDRQTKKLVWSGMDNNDFRPYSSVPRPLLSPDGTKLWFHSCMLQPYEEYTGIYIAVTDHPQPPQELALAPAAKTVSLQWKAPAIGAEIKGYHVYRGDAQGKDFVELTSAAIPQCQFEDATAAPAAGQTYTYMITSEEWSTLESDKSSDALLVNVAASGVTATKGAAVTGWDKTAPPAVEGFSAAKEPDEAGQYRLSWKKSAASDLRHYNVYFSSKEKPQVSQKRLIVSPLAGMTEYLDWSAPTEGPAHYAITAVDRQGNESAPTFADVP